jgi:hypothetical protein
VKFSDIIRENTPKILDEPQQKDTVQRTAAMEYGSSGAARKYESNYGYGKSAMTDSQDEVSYYAGASEDSEFSRFQDRLKRGKVKICDGCGGLMSKTSRTILSPLAGFVLVLLGVGLMTFYGITTNFFQPPWFIKFALPASYYVGSIFIGVGILFFFIREKVWVCHRCKEIRKR